MQSIVLVILLVASAVSASASVHLPLVHKHVRQHKLKFLHHLSCDTAAGFSLLRFGHRSQLWSGTTDIRRDATQKLDASFHHHNHRVGIVLDLQCPLAAVWPLLAAVSERMYFHRSFVWLMFARDAQQISELLANENINVDADITVATRNESDASREVWDLWDVYNPSFERGGRLSVTLLQQWSSESGKRLLLMMPEGRKSKYERRKNFGGLRLKGVLTINDIPAGETLQSHLDSEENVDRDTMSRFNYRLFRMMEEMHNFSIYVLRTGVWGTNENGTRPWNGAIGFTERKEVSCISTRYRKDPL